MARYGRQCDRINICWNQTLETHKKRRKKMTRIKYMDRRNRNPVTSIMLTAVAGGVMGAAAALLLAPKSGRRLRADLVDAYEDLSERGKDLINDAMDRGQNAAKSAGDFAEN